ncbi:MAG: hypothetical protein ACTSQM_02950 [Candidatus Odinarchaeia archaeon]
MSEESPSIFSSIKRKKCISGDELVQLSSKYGERFWKALKAVVEGCVKKYVFKPSGRVEWIVVGVNRDYLIIPDFYCSCRDFYVNVVTRKKAKFCYHILAKFLAESLNLYHTYHVEDDKYEVLMKEWKAIEQ